MPVVVCKGTLSIGYSSGHYTTLANEAHKVTSVFGKCFETRLGVQAQVGFVESGAEFACTLLTLKIAPDPTTRNDTGILPSAANLATRQSRSVHGILDLDVHCPNSTSVLPPSPVYTPTVIYSVPLSHRVASSSSRSNLPPPIQSACFSSTNTLQTKYRCHQPTSHLQICTRHFTHEFVYCSTVS